MSLLSSTSGGSDCPTWNSAFVPCCDSAPTLSNPRFRIAAGYAHLSLISLSSPLFHLDFVVTSLNKLTARIGSKITVYG
ncbi:uncharacterized protein [Montipora capricornis]|uniref:uncharacterized protein isoform X2 n=1 Tax=Montipora capricornis TaxID=246305 RepID=UPI0035F20292